MLDFLWQNQQYIEDFLLCVAIHCLSERLMKFATGLFKPKPNVTETIVRAHPKLRQHKNSETLGYLNNLRLQSVWNPWNVALYSQKVLGWCPMIVANFSSAQLQFKNHTKNCTDTTVAVY